MSDPTRPRKSDNIPGNYQFIAVAETGIDRAILGFKIEVDDKQYGGAIFGDEAKAIARRVLGIPETKEVDI